MINQKFIKLEFSDIRLVLLGALSNLKNKFWSFLLPSLLVSFIMLLAIFVIYHVVDSNNALVSIYFSLATFLLLNLMLTLLLINNKRRKESYFSFVIERFKEHNLLGLIVILTVVEILPSLIFAYLAPQLTNPAQLQIASLILQLFVFVLCFIGEFSMVIGLQTNNPQPFHLITRAIKFIGQNFIVLVAIHVITIMVFMVINVIFGLGIYLQIQEVMFSILVVQFIANLVTLIWSVLVASNCVKVEY